MFLCLEFVILYDLFFALILLSKIVPTRLQIFIFYQVSKFLKLAVMWKLPCMKCAVPPQICLFLRHTFLEMYEWVFVQLLFHVNTSKGFQFIECYLLKASFFYASLDINNLFFCLFFLSNTWNTDVLKC